MVTIKRRFHGVKQGLKRTRIHFENKIYDKFWKMMKKERKIR
jgi:hypothetical protein